MDIRSTGEKHVLRLSASGIPTALTLVATILLAAHAVIVTYTITIRELPWLIVQLVDVNEEHNLPTWFSGFNLLVATLILWMCVQWQRASGAPMRRRWTILLGIFVFLSIDEIAGIHESINTAIEPSWALGGAVLAIVLGLYYLPFLRSLPKSTLITFVAAGALFVGGAVGMELVGEPMDSDSLAYNLTTLVEEGMEMFGVIIFIKGLLCYMRDNGASDFTATIV